jgi:DNA-binding winged helix-turn-helix (wHTH) protein
MEKPDLYCFGPFHLHAARRTIERDGRPLDLTAKEFDLLHELVAEAFTRPGRKLAKEELWKRLWSETKDELRGGYRPSDAIRTHIHNLRKKLNWNGIHGGKEGYILAETVEAGFQGAEATRQEQVQADRNPLPSAGADPSRPPYVGPQPFPPDRSNQFFGRDHDCNELITCLADEERRVVLLFSPSGAGKTSLINTALRTHLLEKNFRVLPVARVGLPPRKDLSIPPEAHNLYTVAALASMGTEFSSACVSAVSWTEYLSFSSGF